MIKGDGVLKTCVPLTICRLVKVHISVAEGAVCACFSAHANGADTACLFKLLEQHRFVHIRVKVSHVERDDGEVGPAQHGR